MERSDWPTARLHNDTAAGSYFDMPQEDDFMEDRRNKMGRQKWVR